jgi:hypothetical protein
VKHQQLVSDIKIFRQTECVLMTVVAWVGPGVGALAAPAVAAIAAVAVVVVAAAAVSGEKKKKN